MLEPNQISKYLSFPMGEKKKEGFQPAESDLFHPLKNDGLEIKNKLDFVGQSMSLSNSFQKSNSEVDQRDICVRNASSSSQREKKGRWWKLDCAQQIGSIRSWTNFFFKRQKIYQSLSLSKKVKATAKAKCHGQTPQMIRASHVVVCSHTEN